MLASILAVTIFLAMFVLIVLDKIEHYLITLGCGLLTIIFVLGICLHSGQAIMEVLNVKSIFTTSFWHTVGQASEDSSGISWATIIFIAGMMVMVEGMKRAGFFTWLCMLIAKLVRYRIVPILITFMILSAFLCKYHGYSVPCSCNSRTLTIIKIQSGSNDLGRSLLLQPRWNCYRLW